MVVIDSWMKVSCVGGKIIITGTVDGRDYHTSVLAGRTVGLEDGDVIQTQNSEYKLGRRKGVDKEEF